MCRPTSRSSGPPEHSTLSLPASHQAPSSCFTLPAPPPPLFPAPRLPASIKLPHPALSPTPSLPPQATRLNQGAPSALRALGCAVLHVARHAQRRRGVFLARGGLEDRGRCRSGAFCMPGRHGCCPLLPDRCAPPSHRSLIITLRPPSIPLFPSPQVLVSIEDALSDHQGAGGLAELDAAAAEVLALMQALCKHRV